MKTCSKCGVEKEDGEFKHNRLTCKGCYKAIDRARDRSGYDKASLIGKPCAACGNGDRYKSGACKHCCRERARRWHTQNPGASAMKHREWRSKNREYINAEHRKWREENRQLSNQYSRAGNHGISRIEMEAFIETRGGACEICRGSGYAIDHDHAACSRKLANGMTRKNANRESIRGLLCHGCNIIIGHYEKGCRPSGGVKQYDAYLRKPRPFAANDPAANVVQLPLALKTDAA